MTNNDSQNGSTMFTTRGFINVFILIAVAIVIGVVSFVVERWQIEPAKIPAGEICQNLCGDGICQEVVCEGAGCSCAETADLCPRDCPMLPPSPLPTPTPVVCTQETKQCPDGSYVGRTGKNCEFAKCPVIQPPSIIECTKDSDCPSTQYMCQEIEGMGTVCPSNDESCVPIHTIIKGECKLKEGNRCSTGSDCAGGNLCHKNICTSPIGRECSGPGGISCPTDFECVQGCGPPIVRENYPPPPYFCQLKGYQRICPICLAEHTLIDTPAGAVPVEEMQQGIAVWTMNKFGERVSGIIIDVAKTPVPSTHKVVHLKLSDGREVFVSPGHPIGDGRTVGELAVGDVVSGSRVISAEKVLYQLGFTYDILPSGETGFYWANGILLESTLY